MGSVCCDLLLSTIHTGLIVMDYRRQKASVPSAPCPCLPADGLQPCPWWLPSPYTPSFSLILTYSKWAGEAGTSLWIYRKCHVWGSKIEELSLTNSDTFVNIRNKVSLKVWICGHVICRTKG